MVQKKRRVCVGGTRLTLDFSEKTTSTNMLTTSTKKALFQGEIIFLGLYNILRLKILRVAILYYIKMTAFDSKMNI